MKHLFMVTAACAALATSATAQRAQTETRDGVRYVIPQEASTLNDDGNLMQNRAIALGLFEWTLPTSDIIRDPTSQPKKVSDCDGHDPEYRPAHSFSSKDEMRDRDIGVGTALLHDFKSYRNALAAGDCTCGSLNADWNEAETQFAEIIVGIERSSRFGSTPTRLHTLIQNDYERMCDVTMTLELD